jgi:hypothetical protein
VGSEYEVKVSAVSPAGYSETAMASRIITGYLNSIPTSYPGKRGNLPDFTIELCRKLQIKDVVIENVKVEKINVSVVSYKRFDLQILRKCKGGLYT